MPAESVRDLMTPDPIVLDADASVAEAARCMRDRDVGDVLVRKDGELRGIVTDRDLVTRCLASEGGDPREHTLADLCSEPLVTISPDAEIGKAAKLMQEHAIRRLPVVEGERPVGIVSLGDLALDREPNSVLGEISAAPPDA